MATKPQRPRRHPVEAAFAHKAATEVGMVARLRSVNVVVRTEKAYGRHIRSPSLAHARNALFGARIHLMELMTTKSSSTTRTPRRQWKHAMEAVFANNAAAKVRAAALTVMTFRNNQKVPGAPAHRGQWISLAAAQGFMN